MKKKPILPPERKQIAKLANLNEQWLYQCLSGRRNMGPAEAIRLEQISNGRISRIDVCQGTWFSIWPDLAKKKNKGIPA